MNETNVVRENKADGKLSKTAICCRCHKPLTQVRKYLVRTVTLPGSGSMAFYYSHVRCRRMTLEEKYVPQVILTSEEFGTEVFDYDTLKEAREGFNRLKQSCQAEANNDGIERRLILALETWTTD